MSSASQFQVLVGQPTSGGDLITISSPENVGISNYVTKLDWRRKADSEIRREGHVSFAPNSDVSPGSQSNIGVAEEITLIHFSRKPNGKIATIAGTKTSLYRYFSFEDGRVYEVDTYDPDVYADVSGQWLKIGDNFSTDGNRWEAIDVAGKTVFNNGVDLPVIYDLDWLLVRPIYELREQGIINAGTIGEFNGMLALGDISEVDAATLLTIMNGRNVSNVSQNGVTASAGPGTFTGADIGKTLLWSTGEYARILNVVSDTIATVDTNQTVAIGPVNIAYLYGTITDTSTYSRVQYRLLVSNVGDADDFGGGVNVPSGTAGSFVITVENSSFAFNIGDEIEIPGADTDGAALTTTITNINGYRNQFTIADAVVTSFTDSYMQRTNRIGSVASSFDIQDDNSAILRVIELQGKLIVLKDGPIYVGQYTGTEGVPISFQKVYNGPFSLYWRWMLAKVGGSYLVYAGSNDFYTFDLSNLVPRLHDKLALCKDIFFDTVNDTTLMNSCWCANNDITDEVWFTFPNSGAQKGICYDYLYNTCSVIGATYTAAATVKKPVDGIPTGALENWFILGDSVGDIWQYGLTDISQGVYTRNGSTYDSILTSGLIAANDSFNEKDLRNYVLLLSSPTSSPLTVTLYGTRNPYEPVTQLFSKTLAVPAYKNLIPTFYRKNYYQDKILVNNNVNAVIDSRIYELAQIDTRSTIRNNSV